MGIVLTMRVSLAVAVFFFFGLTVAQDYAYLTYWSDNRCTNFVGSRVMTENDQFISAANAGSGGCRQELYCLVDASSPDCTAISVTGGGNIRIRTNGNVVTEFFNNDAGTQVDSGSCIESSLYANCWFNYYTDSQVENIFEDDFDCDTSRDTSNTSRSPRSPSSSSDASAIILPIFLILAVVGLMF